MVYVQHSGDQPLQIFITASNTNANLKSGFKIPYSWQ